MKLIKLFLLYIIFICGKARGQSLPTVIPPSPEAAALARYGEIPIGFSTGVPDISVPIYLLKSGKISLPINISYHASGIKLCDMATTVGLGWVLNAGGMITRTVLGKQDENNVFQSPYKTVDDLNAARSAVASDGDAANLIYHLQNISKENFENQSDRYTYSFNGKSGVFRFDWLNGNVHTVPYAPLKITKEYFNNSQQAQDLYYTIVDEKGEKYFFQASEPSTQNGRSSITGWSLTKILSVDQKDEINFYYSTGESMVMASEICSVDAGNGNGQAGSGANLVPPQCVFSRTPFGTTSSPQRLDSIVARDAVIRFDYVADRQDGRQMRLTQIRVCRKGTNEVVRRTTFEHSYFGDATQHNLRLRLDNLKIGGASDTGIEKYSFSYNNLMGPGYYMTNGYTFPGGTSFPAYIAEDYWGYYGKGSGGLPSEYLYFLTPSQLATYGGNRNPDPFGMQMGILQGIKYPTGGSTIFEFESNKSDDPDFYHYPNQQYANDGIIGGLRIKSMRNYNADNTLVNQKTYTYDAIGAAQQIEPALFRYQQQYHYYKTMTDQFGNYIGKQWDFLTFNNVCTSSSVYPLTIMGSSPVIYSQVTEFDGTQSDNIGKTIYSYQIPPETTLSSNAEILSEPKFINGFTTDRGFPEALLQEKTVYKNVGGIYSIVNKIHNNYLTYRANEFLTGIRIDHTTNFVDVNGLYSPDYPDVVLWDYLNSYAWESTKGYENIPLLDNTITTDNSDPSNPVVQTTNYTYSNLEHLQPTQKAVTSSSGDTWITQYKYPHDFASQFPYDQMVNTVHNWSPVIEELQYKNNTGNFLQSTKTEYSAWNGNNAQIYPLIVSLKKGTADYDPRVQFWGYDTKGNVQSVSKVTGAKVNYVWGYGGTYPVAQVANADIASIVSILGGQAAVDSFRDNMSPSDAAVISYINLLRNAPSLSTAQITTYTYKPLVGITSVIDARGNKSIYEYDSFQRLVNIKDQHGNIKTHYCYNYAGQITDCSTLIN